MENEYTHTHCMYKSIITNVVYLSIIDSVADPCYIGGAGYGLIVLIVYRQNYVTKDNFSLTMLS